MKKSLLIDFIMERVTRWFVGVCVCVLAIVLAPIWIPLGAFWFVFIFIPIQIGKEILG